MLHKLSTATIRQQGIWQATPKGMLPAVVGMEHVPSCERSRVGIVISRVWYYVGTSLSYCLVSDIQVDSHHIVRRLRSCFASNDSDSVLIVEYCCFNARKCLNARANTLRRSDYGWDFGCMSMQGGPDLSLQVEKMIQDWMTIQNNMHWSRKTGGSELNNKRTCIIAWRSEDAIERKL